MGFWRWPRAPLPHPWCSVMSAELQVSQRARERAILKPIRPIRIEGDIAYVPLTQGYEAVIDAQDVPLVQGYNWIAFKGRRSIYAARTQIIGGIKHCFFMHRVILGAPKGDLADHIDGNGINNTRKNLRIASPAQNNWNARVRVDNTTGFKGVTYRKKSGRWQARIMVSGKNRCLGSFATAELAHEAYRKASAELHGEFGRVA